MNEIFFILCFFLLLIYSVNAISPYPAKIFIEEGLSYFNLFTYEGEKLVLTNKRTYIIEEDSTHSFSISKYPSDILPAVSNSNTPHPFSRINPEGKRVYIFLYNNAKFQFQIPGENSNSNLISSFTGTKEAVCVTYLSEYIYAISYISNTRLKGNIFLFDLTIQDKTIYAYTDEYIYLGMFGCQYSNKLSTVFCIWGNNTAEILYNQYINTTNTFIPKGKLHQFNDSTITVPAVRFVEANNDQYFGIAKFGLDISYLYVFNVNITNEGLQFNSIEISDVMSYELHGIFLYKVFDNFFMVIGNVNEYNETKKNKCSFYNNNLDKLSVDNKNLAGEQFFDAFISEDNAWYEFLYKEADGYLYYIKHEIMKCKDKSYFLSKGESFSIDYDDLIINTLEYPHPNNGIRFRVNTSNVIIGGTLKEVDENGNELGDVTYFNDDYFYKKAIYHALSPGNFVIKYTLIAIVTDDFYIPSQECRINIETKCYSSCASCYDFGDETNHYCITCISNYYFLDGTSNCYQSLAGYYKDQVTLTYKKCDNNCDACDDANSCYICANGYSLLSFYTQNESDKICIETCYLSTSRWYLDEGTNNVICLANQDYCPPEYNCYNKERKLCLPNSSSSDCTIELSASITETNEIFDVLSSNIISFYENNYTTSTEKYTTLVYDTQTNSQESTGLTNLTIVNLSECEMILKDIYKIENEEPLIIAQIDYKNEDVPVNTVAYILFSISGRELNISYCNGVEITITSPINNSSEITLTYEQISRLYNSGIDVFDSQHSFFNERCFNFTSDDGTDVPLLDRRNDYYQNVSLCASGCTYSGINIETFTVNCTCSILEEEEKNEDNFYSSFSRSISEANFEVVKCYQAVFNSDIIFKNIGSYIMFGMFIIHVVNFILFLSRKRVTYNKFVHSWIKKISLIPFFQRIKQQAKKSAETPEDEGISEKENDKSPIQIPILNIKVVSKDKTVKPIEEKIYSNNVLDNMNLQEAMEKDKRSFFELYKLRILNIHPLLFACCSHPNKTVRYVTIGVLLFGFETDLALNALFYNDEYISKSYHKGGIYDLKDEIPKSFYSSLSNLILGIFCSILAKSFPDEDELNLSAVKTKVEREKIKQQISDHIRKLHYIFFLISFLFIIFYWYYVSAFCAVYQNSQVGWLIDSIVSFGLSMILPFFIALICVCSRLLSLNIGNEKLLYFSKFLE